MAKKRATIFISALFAMVANTSASTEGTLPIFDTHVHYSEGDWQSFSPKTVIEMMQEAGVIRALVSSTPDDGTLLLYREDAERIVPELRPYRNTADMENWFQSAEVLAYIEQRLAKNIYRGIGEFHLLERSSAATEQVARLVTKAVHQNLVLHVHSDSEVVRALFTLDPNVKILWAHAGVNATPTVIEEMLDSYPALWTEVSLRAGEINPQGHLDAAWRALFLKHPDRFMVGTDTWAPFRWPDYVELVGEHRAWLRQLPAAVAAKIAHNNAARLFLVRPERSN